MRQSAAAYRQSVAGDWDDTYLDTYSFEWGVPAGPEGTVKAGSSGNINYTGQAYFVDTAKGLPPIFKPGGAPQSLFLPSVTYTRTALSKLTLWLDGIGANNISPKVQHNLTAKWTVAAPVTAITPTASTWP